MKGYLIQRTQGGKVTCEVVGKNTGSLAPGVEEFRPLKHVVYHSPTGFETGYAGSGPADLALSILLDFFHEGPAFADGKAMFHHQQFKLDFLASRPLKIGETSVITEEEIHRWYNTGARSEGDRF